MIDEPKPLSPRHVRFVAEYLKDLNATQAYIRAGYAPRSAQVNASKLLRHPQVQAAVAEGHKQIAQATQISVEQIAAEYARIALANIDDFTTIDADGRLRIDLSKADRAKRGGLVEVSVTDYGEDRPQRITIKLGKLQALAALAQNVGLLVTRPEPGMTAEDRKRMEWEAAACRRIADDERKRFLAAEDELFKTRRALKAAEEKVAQVGVVPPSDVPAATPTTRRPASAQPPENAPAATVSASRQLPARGTPEHAMMMNQLRSGTLSSADAMLLLLSG